MNGEGSHADGDRARANVRVSSTREGWIHERNDIVVVEEPLEIRLVIGDAKPEALLLTMRTPGRPSDFELSVGLLWAEGVVHAPEQVIHVGYCLDPDLSAEQHYNVVTVTLSADVTLDRARLARSLAVTSACGVCGKTTLEQLSMAGYEPLDPARGARIDAATLYELPARLRAAQGIFSDTGGLHGAGLFDMQGALLAAREDVGRHNSVDKLVGWAIGEGRLPLADCVMVVSGRAGFEILQKAMAAGISIVASVSAPSSLAVSLADRFGLTLVGFLRGTQANVYTGAHRLTGLESRPEPGTDSG